MIIPMSVRELTGKAAMSYKMVALLLFQHLFTPLKLCCWLKTALELDAGDKIFIYG